MSLTSTSRSLSIARAVQQAWSRTEISLAGRPWAVMVRSVLWATAVVLAGAVTPLLPTNDQKADFTLIAGLLVLLGGYVGWRGNSGVGRSALDIPVLAFLTAGLLATVASPNPFASFFPSRSRGEGWLVYVGYGLITCAAARLDRRQTALAVGVLAAAGTIMGLAALAQYYGLDPVRWLGYAPTSPGRLFGLHLPQDEVSWVVDRSYGTLGNPIFLGGFSVLLLPLLLGAALSTRHPGARRMLLVAGLLTAAALYASGTRAALAAIGLSSFLLAWFLRRRPGALRTLLLFACATALVWTMLSLTRTSTLGQRVVSAFGQDSSLSQRIYVWKHVLPMIAQRPGLGWGFSNLLGRFPDLGSREYFQVWGYAVSAIDTPHNEVLHVAFSTGLVGLGAYTWIWLVVLRGLARSVWRSSEEDAWYPLRAGLLVALVGYGCWLQSAWSHVGPANVFWVAIGLAVALLPRGSRGVEATREGESG